MSSLSSVQRWGQLRELSNIKGVCGHSGSADKVSRRHSQQYMQENI